MDPTAEELSKIKFIKDAFAWAGAVDPALAAVLAKLGATGDEPVRLLGLLPEDDFRELVQSAKVRVVDGEAEVVLKPLQRNCCIVSGRVARLACGAGTAASATGNAGAAAAPQVGAGGGVGINRFKFSAVVDQASDVEMTVLDGHSLKGAYVEYKRVFGSYPPEEEELSSQQLTAMKGMLDVDQNPYVDFAVWGPYSYRLMRKHKLSGTTFNSAGELIPVEWSGLPSHDDWAKCDPCLRTGLVSWRAVDLGIVDSYSSLIKRYHTRYGPAAWLIIYQADVRCRSEHMERLRRVGDEERALTEAAGGTHPLSAGRPWNWVWAKAVSDGAFWHAQLEEPAMCLLNRIKASSTAAQDSGQGTKRTSQDWDATAVHKMQRVHNVAGDRFTTNRKGISLCQDFQQGRCSSGAKNDTRCPKNANEVHQCAICLDFMHGAHACTRTCKPALSEPPASRGKGKGRGTEKQRWQY